MCVETLRTSAHFSKTINLRGHMPQVYSEKWMFSHLSPWKPHKCMLKPSEQCSFFRDNQFKGSNASGLVWKMNVFPPMSLRNTINVCWNPWNSAHFSKTINLRGHMPRFTLKMNIFPSISSRNPRNVCWNPQNRAHFSKMIHLRGHMPRFSLKNECFPTYVLKKPHKCVLEPSEQGSFF